MHTFRMYLFNTNSFWWELDNKKKIQLNYSYSYTWTRWWKQYPIMPHLCHLSPVLIWNSKWITSKIIFKLPLINPWSPFINLQKRKEQVTMNKNPILIFQRCSKHLHSIWPLSKALFNSWSQIALFTAKALVKWAISILTIHYSNGTLPHKLQTWWITYVND